MIQFRNNNCCVFESTLFKTTSTVLWTDDLILVVDPTWLPHEVAEISHFTDAIKGDRPVYLLFTHSDYDHILGYGAFTDATVIASRAFADNPETSSILSQIQKFDHDYYIDRPYKMVYPQVDIIIEKSSQKLVIGQTELIFYLAPGHNPDGLFTLVEPLGVWIAGDYLSDVEFPYIYHCSQAYEESLEVAKLILDRHEPKLLIPGHGQVTESGKEMKKRIVESFQYIISLRKSILDKQPFNEAVLWERYDFPLGMKPFHDNNLTLIKKELFTNNNSVNV